MAGIHISSDHKHLKYAAVCALLGLMCIRNVAYSGSRTFCQSDDGKVQSHGENVPTVRLQHLVRESPFPDLKGERYHIFHPIDTTHTNSPVQLLAAPELWIKQLTRRYLWLDERTIGFVGTPEERSVSTYIEMIRRHVSGVVYGDNEKRVQTKLAEGSLQLHNFDESVRSEGRDWAYLGVTMTGRKRLENVENLIRDVIKNDVEGDYIETGVWRGGSSILARAVLRSLHQGHRRSFVCDSFRGLPPGDRGLHKKDKNWDNIQYLEVSSEEVATNFWEAGVMDSNVVFVKGFFNETMPPLAPHVDKLSIMRLDGDMYESTVDVLYHLYGKLSVGGYVIMDDWFGFPSRTACEHFFTVHGITVDIIRIDSLSIYWQKKENVQVQFWRYEQSKFTDN